MNKERISSWWRFAGVVIVVILIFLRWVDIGNAIERMDNTFLILVALLVAIIIVPWERITTFKAAGVEFTLDKPSVKTAIEDVTKAEIHAGAKRSTSEEVEQRLEVLKPLVEQIQGGRILWIDDNPNKPLAQRRLLRALGAVVIMAQSSDKAWEILKLDNDFDLIISDVQRQGEYHKFNDGVEIHDGVNFIVWLRTTQDYDTFVRTLPVLFYAAYDWARLVKFTLPAKQTQPDVDFCNAPADLIEKAIVMLAKSRTQALTFVDKKEATRIGPHIG
jgi:CheY-like chemotaxis protein